MNPGSIPPLFPYRAILCRYSSEIPLKSKKYQDRILKLLRQSIVQMCKNHALTLQTLLPLQGRMICFFPIHEIPQACRVFRIIAGLESFSPVLSSSRKIPDIVHQILPFVTERSKRVRFSISLHAGVKLKVSNHQFLDQIKRELQHTLRDNKINAQLMDQGEIHITIEIREKGVYLFTEKFESLVGGFPLESSNALMVPWWEIPSILPATLLMLRRGALLTPCLFDYSCGESNQLPRNPDQVFKFCAKIAPQLMKLTAFYPYPLPFMLIPASSMFSQFIQLIPPKWDQRIFLWALEAVIMEDIRMKSRQHASISYNQRNLHYKGLVYAISSEEKYLIQLFNNFSALSLFPLIGLTLGDKSRLDHLIKTEFQSLFLKNEQVEARKQIKNRSSRSLGTTSIALLLQNMYQNPNSMKISPPPSLENQSIATRWSLFFKDHFPKYPYGKEIPPIAVIDQFFADSKIKPVIRSWIHKINSQKRVLQLDPLFFSRDL